MTFGFWRGGELSDPKGRLEGGPRMKHVKIRGAENVRNAQLAARIKEAVPLNERKGNPTRGA